MSWPGFPQWASQLARDTLRKLLETRMRTEFYSEGEKIKVVTDIFSRDGRFEFLESQSEYHGADQESQERTFQQSAPGRYESKFIPTARGIHFLSLYAEGNAGEAPVPLATVSYIAPYPKEYRELKPNISLLSRLAEKAAAKCSMPKGSTMACGVFTRRRREKAGRAVRLGGRSGAWRYSCFL